MGASMPGRCGVCGGEAWILVRDGVTSDGRLLWSTATHCQHCLDQAPLDPSRPPWRPSWEPGRGPLPEDLRRALLADDPAWELTVEEADPPTEVLSEALREVMGLDGEEAARRCSNLPGPLASGTWAEIEALRLRLTAAGVPASKGWASDAHPVPVSVRIENRRDEPVEVTYGFKLVERKPDSVRTVVVPPRSPHQEHRGYLSSGHSLEVQAKTAEGAVILDRAFAWTQRRTTPTQDVFEVVIS